MTTQARLSLASALTLAGLFTAAADAQFRRGFFSESTEITLYPHDLPAILLPAGSVQIEVRNASSASARIVERLEDLMARQLTDNDARLNVVDRGADVVVTATLIDWRESRRNSSKYVSEQRQIGTRQVRDKNGKTKTEPIYEYGRNKPSVVIDASAVLRLEVKRGRATAMADETVRHAIREEHLVEEGPPTRDAVEDMLVDRVVQKGAARISPGRITTRVLLARSEEVDRLNALAQNRHWHDWLEALSGIKPHRDPKRDAYRVHNLAIAQEAIAYESTATEDWVARLNLAGTLIRRAAAQNPNEKYIEEAAERIEASQARYRQLAELYRAMKPVTTTAMPSPATSAPDLAASATTTATAPATTAPSASPSTAAPGSTPTTASGAATPAAATPAASKSADAKPEASKPAATAPARSAPRRAPPPSRGDTSKTSSVQLEKPLPPPGQSMGNQDVIDLRKAGLDDDNLIAAINDAKAVSFDLSPAGLRTLLAAKVSNRVIAAMRARAK